MGAQTPPPAVPCENPSSSTTKVDDLRKKLEAARTKHLETGKKRKLVDVEPPLKEEASASLFAKGHVGDSAPSFSSVLFLEIFSGTGGLTCCIRKLGFQGIGIDFEVSKACKSPIIRLDLTSSHGQTLLFGDTSPQQHRRSPSSSTLWNLQQSS